MKTEFKIGNLYSYNRAVTALFLCLEFTTEPNLTRPFVKFFGLKNGKIYSLPVDSVEERFVPFEVDE